MKYTTLLKEHDIKPTEAGTKKIQALINDLHGVEQAVTLGESQIAEGTLSATKSKKLQKDVDQAKEAIPEMDEAICDAITAWLPRREEFAKKVKSLQAGQQAKKQGTQATPAAAPAKATSAPVEEKGKPGTTTKAPETVPEEKKKKSNGLAWIIGAIVLLAGAAVGVNMANRSR